MERRLRLREEREVRTARAKGKAFADGPLVARVWFDQRPGDPPDNRYAVVAGKRAGKAVDRNRLKRLVRESLRRLHPSLKPGHHIVVIVRGDLAEMPGCAVALATLERIFRRARLLSSEPSASHSLTGHVDADASAQSERHDHAVHPSTSPVDRR